MRMGKHDRTFQFAKPYNSPTEVLTDHRLASLGDAYVNFIYSLALSNKKKQPSEAKVKGSLLAEALRRAKLRVHAIKH